jgi:hypothetical protein
MRTKSASASFADEGGGGGASVVVVVDVVVVAAGLPLPLPFPPGPATATAANERTASRATTIEANDLDFNLISMSTPCRSIGDPLGLRLEELAFHVVP